MTTTRKLALAALSTGLVVALAGCGAANSSHVVSGTTVPASSVTTTTTVVATGSAATTVPGAATPTTSVSSTLSANTLNQVAAELGTLDANLSTADNDLDHPQGDS